MEPGSRRREVTEWGLEPRTSMLSPCECVSLKVLVPTLDLGLGLLLGFPSKSWVCSSQALAGGTERATKHTGSLG